MKCYCPLSQIESLFIVRKRIWLHLLACHLQIPGKEWPFIFHVINCSIPCHKLLYSMSQTVLFHVIPSWHFVSYASYYHDISCRTCHIIMIWRVVRVSHRLCVGVGSYLLNIKWSSAMPSWLNCNCPLSRIESLFLVRKKIDFTHLRATYESQVRNGPFFPCHKLFDPMS